MKNFCFVLLLAFTGVCCSCNNDDDSDLPPIEQLPPQTTVGANTAGCLVNGEVLIPKGNANQSTLRCQYAKRGDEYTFVLYINNKESNPSQSVRLLYSQDYPLIENKAIPLTIPNVKQSSWGDFFIAAGLIDTFSTNEEYKGQLLILALDETRRIISGTFSFTAINDQGETVEITDGRFDMRYIP